MRTPEDLNRYLTDFYGKKALDSKSYWIPEKIYYVDQYDSKLVVLMANENGQSKHMSLDIIDNVSGMKFEESFISYADNKLNLIWEEK